MSDESKFNFSEDENSQMTNEMNKENAVEEKKEAVRKDAQGLFASVKTFLRELLDFRDDTDRDATITAIKAERCNCLDFGLFHFCGFGRLERRFYCSGYWCHVNITINGPNFRCWFIYSN